jgi:hypothetical protein
VAIASLVKGEVLADLAEVRRLADCLVYRALAPRRSSSERSLNKVGELRVPLGALIDDLVEEVRSVSHCGDRSGWHLVYELAYRL